MTLDYRKIIGAIGIVVVFFAVTLWALNTFTAAPKISPPLAELPPLKAKSRPSFVVAPVAIALTAIRSSLDAAAPRDFNGQNNNPVSQLLGKAQIGLTVGRGPLAVTGRSEALTVNVPLTGTVHITGEVGSVAGKTVGGIGGAIGGLLGGNVGKQIETLANKVFDQRTDIKGNVSMVSRPALTRAWRLDPNLSAQVNLGDTGINVAGTQDQPRAGDQAVARSAGERSGRVLAGAAAQRPDDRDRGAARMAEDVPLDPARRRQDRPPRAVARIQAGARFRSPAQDRRQGRDADHRRAIRNSHRPERDQAGLPVPDPARTGAADGPGASSLSRVPIDLPFTELSTLLEGQIKGQKFPKDATASPVEVEVRKAEVAAAGDRLLISLLVKAVERKSWFGFGAEATVHIWGKPVLEQQQQILRLTELSLAVESEAAFGLLGAAARAAVPYLQDALAKNAVIDLKPFAADARAKIAAAAADFRQVTPGVSVDTAITDLRLIGIEFNSKTLRVITETQGTAKVAVTELPK